MDLSAENRALRESLQEAHEMLALNEVRLCLCLCLWLCLSLWLWLSHTLSHTLSLTPSSPLTTHAGGSSVRHASYSSG